VVVLHLVLLMLVMMCDAASLFAGVQICESSSSQEAPHGSHDGHDVLLCLSVLS